MVMITAEKGDPILDFMACFSKPSLGETCTFKYENTGVVRIYGFRIFNKQGVPNPTTAVDTFRRLSPHVRVLVSLAALGQAAGKKALPG